MGDHRFGQSAQKSRQDQLLLCAETYGVNAQPYYVLQGRDGKTLVPPRGYDLNVENFVQFLRSGVEAYKKQQ